MSEFVIKEWIGKGIKNLVKGSPNLNAVNILRSLIEDDDCICYIPLSYSAEKKTTTDPKIHFNPIEAGKSITATTIQSNQERFNFSITGEVDIYVESENENGTISLEPKKIFRTYTIIRDGELTIDYIIAKLSKETFIDLRHAGILYYNGVQVPENHEFVSDFLYKVVLKDIPVISLAWAQPENIGLYEYLDYENKLSNTLKIVNSKIKEFKENGQVINTSLEDSIYYNESYFGEEKIGSKKLVECIIYEVENNNEVIDEYISKCIDINEANKIKKLINKKLKNVRFINRCVIMAIEKSSNKGNYDWSELSKIPRSKDKMFQICEVKGYGKTYTLKRTIFNKEF